MAGDWIKLEHATPDKPEVYRLARMLGVSRGDAFLLAVEWWIWLDRNSRNGNVTHLLRQDVDDLMRCPGFATAMEAVGWLRMDARDGGTVPNFDRHNGKTAKDRALTKDRVARSRNDDVTQESLPEKRREEKRVTTESRADALANARPAKPVHAAGTRLDPLWTLPIEWLEWALGERPDWTSVDAERVALVFRDHWHAKPGKEGRKADWQATWRNWVRNERRNYRSRPDQPPTLAEKRARNMDILTGKVRDERAVTGVAERVGKPTLLAISGDLREPSGDDVGGCGPERSAGGMG